MVKRKTKKGASKLSNQKTVVSEKLDLGRDRGDTVISRYYKTILVVLVIIIILGLGYIFWPEKETTGTNTAEPEPTGPEVEEENGGGLRPLEIVRLVVVSVSVLAGIFLLFRAFMNRRINFAINEYARLSEIVEKSKGTINESSTRETLNDHIKKWKPYVDFRELQAKAYSLNLNDFLNNLERKYELESLAYVNTLGELLGEIEKTVNPEKKKELKKETRAFIKANNNYLNLDKV